MIFDWLSLPTQSDDSTCEGGKAQSRIKKNILKSVAMKRLNKRTLKLEECQNCRIYLCISLNIIYDVKICMVIPVVVKYV